MTGDPVTSLMIGLRKEVYGLVKGGEKCGDRTVPSNHLISLLAKMLVFISAGKPSLCLYPGDKEEPGNLLDEVISLSLNGLSMFRTPEGLLLAVKP